MRNYNHKLNRLERKYLFGEQRGFFETGRFIIKTIHELYGFYQEKGYQICRVVGMKEATTMFYKMVPEFPVVLTSYEDESTVDWESYTAEDAVLIIGSFYSSRRIERRFWNMHLKCAILNIYDYFYLRGYEVHTDFWKYCCHRGIGGRKVVERAEACLRHYYFRHGIWHKILNRFSISDRLAENAIWSRTYCARKAYDSKQGNIDMHVMYLQRFISECIKGRDYLTAQKYIREYRENGFDDADKYQSFLEKWEYILEEMKEKIKKRNQEDIIINWLDAVSRNRMENMPYLRRLGEDNTQFNQAYTVTPWTSWCMKTIFTGTETIEGKLYRYKVITDKNYSLMRKIKKKNYRFYYIGPRIFQKKIFLDRDCASSEMKEHEISFTYYYWKMLCLLAQSRRKLFLIVHELYATHPPYFSPELDFYEEGNGELAKELQKDMSCRYMDEQLKWWDSFLNEKICSIYMGDHGDPRQKPNYDYLNGRTNIMFIIRNGKRNLNPENRFFSLKDMGKLLEYIMRWDEREEESIYSDEVRIEGLDRYDRGIIDELLKKKGERYADYRNWMQFRALRTKTDLLVRFANGQDWYFLLPDEETNNINKVDCQKRIQELKDRLGEDFINIWEENFFLQSRRLYQESEKI